VGQKSNEPEKEGPKDVGALDAIETRRQTNLVGTHFVLMRNAIQENYLSRVAKENKGVKRRFDQKGKAR
jgi:hypothetical protein